MKRMTETAIEELKSIHLNKYSYSKFVFINTKDKAIITCPIHGDFEQSFEKHKAGQGCKKCSGNEKKTTVSIIKEFREIHGDRYNYDLVNYVDIDTPVQIECKEHGVFEQTPYSHKKGSGCKKCAGRDLTNKELINDFKKVHGNKYTYKKVNYISFSEKIIVTCKKHGDFEIKAADHKYGKGCPKCSGKNLNKSELIAEFNKKHGNIYDYSLFKFKKAYLKSEIICKKHGIFHMSSNMHKSGRGCPHCSNTGFDIKKPAILYYLRIEKDGEIAYKIGITNNTLKERFGKDMKYITPINVYWYEYGEEALSQEQKIIKEYSYAKWDKSDIIKNGNTELFKYDILNLDI